MKGNDVKGKIVILNGTSCSGKSTTARAFQETMVDPYMHVGLDYFEAMQPKKFNQVFYGDGMRTGDLVPVMHACIAHMADEGVNVVVEHILLKRRWLRDAVERLSGYNPLFVGVWCPVDVLLQREAERSRRPESSQIERHFKQIDALFQLQAFDLVVDTTKETSENCVKAIEQQIDSDDLRAFRNRSDGWDLEAKEEYWR